MLPTTLLCEPIVEAPSVYLSKAQLACQRWLGRSLAMFDGATGELLHRGEDQPPLDHAALLELAAAASRRGRVEVLVDEAPLLVITVPMPTPQRAGLVAVGGFVTPSGGRERFEPAARLLGVDARSLADWAERQDCWLPEAIERAATLLQALWLAESRVAELQNEVSKVSANLVSTYEEISLLYRLTQNLRLSASDEDLGRMALDWLADVLPARCLAIQYLPLPVVNKPTAPVRTQTVLVTHGDCPLDSAEFTALREHLRIDGSPRPTIVNLPLTLADSWPAYGVRQIAIVPLTEGDNVFGYLAAINHLSDAEFGSIEGNLLGSVAAILGIHSGNIELYRQQEELLSGVVRALTSAIDAKDPYTCGHSDRVARVAVRLAEELGLSKEETSTIYLSGLLHDIGKIGIDDNVLRKPGKLTESEYEHIKTHVEIGFRILIDLKQLDEVLPVVRHHHEAWDGTGYPLGLKGEETPLMARIVGVADAFDAMSSDRPYRRGMPDEKLDAILRAGAGRQWDARVVEAFFAAREDIRHIAERDSSTFPSDFFKPRTEPVTV